MVAFTYLSAVAAFFASVSTVYGASGITTFNDYGTQTGVACSGYKPTNSQGSNIYAAAIGDLSPVWTGPKCQGSLDPKKCNGHGGCTNCAGPACPGQGTCGKCFNIKCTGPLNGETSGKCSGKTVKVKVVDACPSEHPLNYCKTPAFGGTTPALGSCEAPGVNQFDIATSARAALSSYKYNLYIDIEGPVAC
ncbi:hypothetical protein BD410DRAFT_837233 [Rickenella mellea]|uniref:Expansin-like EG45 domain-containing protein n=1 Tax=Rickenella mellea TaxID=50990 RepID=A0A4Y7QES4_9AGAM|nr:hypothetical protein BD410DRAFT_837233 [Rickenella mellea]